MCGELREIIAVKSGPDFPEADFWPGTTSGLSVAGAIPRGFDHRNKLPRRFRESEIEGTMSAVLRDTYCREKGRTDPLVRGTCRMLTLPVSSKSFQNPMEWQTI